MAFNFDSESKASYIFWTLMAFAIGVFIFSLSFSVGGYVAFAVLGSPNHAQGQETRNAVLGSSTSTSSIATNESTDREDAPTPILYDNTVYSLKPQVGPPKVSAKEYLIGDMDTGKVIIEKDGTTTYPLASVTKLMTALVSKELDNQEAVATISTTSIATYGTEGELHAGEKIIVSDLFYPMLLESSNDAAEALAEHYGRDKFLKAMNDTAEVLGMKETHYDDASGLSYKNVTSAEDLFKLTKYIRDEFPSIYNTARIKEYAILGHTWINHNDFLALSSFVGGKNGYTDEALYTTAAIFNLPVKVATSTATVKHNLVIVLLHSKSRVNDVQILLNYIKNNVSVDSKTATSTSK